jgi:hypothetical protein
VPEPRWASSLGQERATEACVVHAADADDGLQLFIAFERHGKAEHTVCAFLDPTLGGIAKHVGVLGPMELTEGVLAVGASPGYEMRLEAVSPEAAASMLLDALEQRDATLQPPAGEGFPHLRALVEARARALSVLRMA